MILDLREVFAGRVRSLDVRTAVDFSSYEVGGVVPVPGGVNVVGKVYSRADIVCFEYTAQYEYCAPCDRCAVPLKRDYSRDYSHTVVNEISNQDDEDFLVAENMRINIDEIVYTDVVLDFPFKFLCSDDCKGLCSGCGRNLNFESCTCIKQVDPRLSKLDEFFN